MSWLGEFLELAKVGDRGERLQEVCKSLRGLGFSNSELSSLSGGVYPTSSVNRWTKGVEVTSSVEKDELMSELQGLVEGQHSVEDIKTFKKADTLLRGKPLNFERLVGLAEEFDSVKSTPTDLHCLAVQLGDSGMMVADVKRGLETLKSLEADGLSLPVQRELLRAANKYKTAQGILEAINAAADLGEALQLRVNEEAKVKELQERQAKAESEITSLKAEMVHLIADIALAKALREKYHFDQNSMNGLMGLAEKHGSVTGVIGALNAYTDLKQIEGKAAEAEARKGFAESQIRVLNGEVQQIQSTINALNQTLGAVEQLTKSSRQIMILAELVLRPREVAADDYEIAKLCTALLDGMQERAARSAMDPKLQRIIRTDVNIAARALDLYLRDVK